MSRLTTATERPPPLTEQQKKQMLPLMRRAVQLQAMRWDVELRIEGIAGREFNSEETIKEYATAVDNPSDRKALNNIVTLEAVESLEEAE
jgi:hypothetical protein